MHLCFRAWQAVWVLSFCWAAVGLLPAAAQSSSPPGSLDLADLSHRPLGEALVALQHELGIDLTYDPALVEGRWSRSVRAAGETPEAMLTALLRGTGIVFYRLDSGTYALEADTRYVPSGFLTGRVEDAATGLPLSQAHVLVWREPARRESSVGTAAGRGGYFEFGALSPGRYHVKITHLGYQSESVVVTISVGAPTRVEVQLRKEILPLTPIVVEDSELLGDLSVRGHTASHDDLRRANALGAADAVRSLAELPGVQVGEAMANIHIQGGESGEHQFRLDGVPVFEPVHLRGLVGAFNPFALEQITVHKAGFSVAEGSYLAGVINAEHALGGSRSVPLDVQLDPMSLNARAQLGLGDPEHVQARLMAAYRTSVWDVYSPSRIDSLLVRWNRPDPFLLRANLLTFRDVLSQVEPAFARRAYDLLLRRLDEIPAFGLPDLGFSDLHVAGQLSNGGRHTLHTSYYRSENHLESLRLLTTLREEMPEDDDDAPDRYAWLNENAQIHGRLVLSPRALLTTRFYSSRYRLRHSYTAFDQSDVDIPSPLRLPIDTVLTVVTKLVPSDDGNRIREIGFASTLDYDHGGGALLLGVEAVRTGHRFQIDDAFTRSIIQQDSTWRLAGFAEETLRLGPARLTGGLRLTYLAATKLVYAEPRLDLRLRFPATPVGGLGLRAAGGLYRQFFNQFELSNISPSIIFPALRFWMPVDDTVVPPKAIHAAGNLLWTPSPTWSFQVEGYYKDQIHLLQIDYPRLWQRAAPNTPPNLTPITTQAGFLRPTTGYAYGAAFSAERVGRRLRTAARYEYNIARRHYVFRNRAGVEAVPWSEPNRIELAFDWLPLAGLSANARYRFVWGRTWAFRQAYYDFLGIDPAQGSVYGRYDFREPSDHPLKAFRQIDLGAAYTHTLGPAMVQLRFDVINLLNQKNVAERTLQQGEAEDGKIIFLPEDRYLIERTLSMALRLRW